MNFRNKRRFAAKNLVPISPFNRALKYLSLRARSIKEMNDYLTKKGYPQEEIDETLKQLIELKFLNDDDFARQFIENRQRKGKSKQSIAFELKLKGLSKDQTEEVLEDAKSDIKTALLYIEKRLRQFERYDKETRRKKIITRLRSRGYNWDIISEILKKLTKISSDDSI